MKANMTTTAQAMIKQGEDHYKKSIYIQLFCAALTGVSSDSDMSILDIVESATKIADRSMKELIANDRV
jgi:hypothetical protein